MVVVVDCSTAASTVVPAPDVAVNTSQSCWLALGIPHTRHLGEIARTGLLKCQNHSLCLSFCLHMIVAGKLH